jgi:hypothetical protein
MPDYGHPIQLNIVGDTALAAPYIGRAKSQAVALADMFGNIVREGAFSGTVSYKIVIAGDFWSVTIFTNTDCPIQYDSGVYSSEGPAFTPTLKYLSPEATSAWIVAYKMDAYGNYVLQGNKQIIDKTALPWILNQKDGKHVAKHIGTEISIGETELSLDDVAAEQSKMATYTPSKFSGTMRKVMQMLQGSNSLFIGEFDYKFDKTHGIFVDSNDEWWVIRVDGSIWRRRAHWCVKKHKTRTDLRTFVGWKDDAWTLIGAPLISTRPDLRCSPHADGRSIQVAMRPRTCVSGTATRPGRTRHTYTPTGSRLR